MPQRNSARCNLVAALRHRPAADGSEIEELPPEVSCLEIRTAQVGELPAAWFRRHFAGQLIYAFGHNADNGHGSTNGVDRHQQLARAAAEYDLVEFDVAGDVTAELLTQVPPHRRMIAWYGRAASADDLRRQFDEVSRIPARFYKLVPQAASPADALPTLSFLDGQNADNIIAYASGIAGCWSRVIVPHLGSPWAVGAVTECSSDDGEPTVRQLVDDFGLPQLHPLRHLYGIVGRPVSRSWSPRLHNAAYRLLGYPAAFVAFEADDFADFVRRAIASDVWASIGINLDGLTVASPHKEAALEFADESGRYVRRAKSSNALIRTVHGWRAETTDATGVMAGLAQRHVALESRRVAVIGCGGSGRAMAAALCEAGAEVTLVNRGLQRGRFAAKLLNMPLVPLSDFDPAGFRLIVNATPLGHNGNALPSKFNDLDEDAVVVDLVYGDGPSPLISKSRRRGRQCLDGRDVLILQVQRQFQLMTGCEMPPEVERQLVDHVNVAGLDSSRLAALPENGPLITK